MKIDKKKVVFGSVLVCILAFIIAYYLMMFASDQDSDKNLDSNPQVPGVQEPDRTYQSRIQAVNDLEARKPLTAPSLYEDINIDSLPEAEERDKSMDSLSWTMKSWSFNTEQQRDSVPVTSDGMDKNLLKDSIKVGPDVSSEVLALVQEGFFAINHANMPGSNPDKAIRVFVDGDHIVRENSRVRMRLDTAMVIQGTWYERLTPIYAFVRFGPNRVFLNIEYIQHHPVTLQAYDLADGNKGIYTENNFRADLSRQILDDAIDEINIPSLPQVNGISRLFRKSNRQVKVSIPSQYTLLLKRDLKNQSYE
ncbi:conjugative transposon protein TraM [Christiangramia flava]|uniref:conjugative transposon protein TraM n=1 Tax=Christiangramia flava TaxID=1486245 RepID=UPI0009FB7710|nr:conjugative transposon protein TraM [Christiangramia flava]